MAMNEFNEVQSGGGPAIRPLGSVARNIASPVHMNAGVRGLDGLDVTHSEGGYNFSGTDSLGSLVKGFVQTEDVTLAANELERAGIRVQSMRERRGPRKKNR